MKKKQVFISGVAGFLGSHLADLLLSEGHCVVGCDNLHSGDIENVPKEVHFFQYDLKDFQANLKHTKNIDAIFHAAATPYDGFSLFAPHIVTENIYTASASLISAAIENNVDRFIFCSSMSRYGNQQAPFREDMSPQPVTPYGIAKVAVENLLHNLCMAHGMEYVICVPHNIIGPRQKYDDPYRNVASIMINRMLQGMQPIIYGNGGQKRCFSAIWDTLQVFERLLFAPEACGQVLNVGPDEEYITINELAQTIASLIGFDLQPIYYPSRPNEVQFANCSADKARQMFQYQTKYSLQDTLKQMISWIIEKRPKPFDYHLPIEINSALTPRTWSDRAF